MTDAKEVRERLEDVHDGGIDWVVGRWEMFDWTNLKSTRNWWAT